MRIFVLRALVPHGTSRIRKISQCIVLRMELFVLRGVGREVGQGGGMGWSGSIGWGGLLHTKKATIAGGLGAKLGAVRKRLCAS